MINIDCWYEILVRVDPTSIFNCILVCKPCLEVITSPEFRRTYQKKWNWKANSRLVGLASHEYKFSLFATSRLGRIMKDNMPDEPVEDFFICKSGEGDGVILYGSLSLKRLFVSRADESPVLLPLPPVLVTKAGTAILSRGDSYEVILAVRNDNKLIIQSFSSSSGDWGVSEHGCPHECKFLDWGVAAHDVDDLPREYKFGDPGMVSSSRGMVYWRGGRWLVMYDANNRCLSWTESPNEGWFFRHFGLSSRGNLQCATTWDGKLIKVWGFDDDDKEGKYWYDFDYVDPCPPTSFVSFFPGESESMVVIPGGQRQLSLYNLDTNKLESGIPLPEGECYDDRRSGIDMVPLTMADLGVWPSSPFSNTTQTNISGVKQMLAFAPNI